MTFATSMLWPVLVHVGLVCLLHAWLTYTRTVAVKRGEVDCASFEFNREQMLALEGIGRPS